MFVNWFDRELASKNVIVRKSTFLVLENQQAFKNDHRETYIMVKSSQFYRNFRANKWSKIDTQPSKITNNQTDMSAKWLNNCPFIDQPQDNVEVTVGQIEEEKKANNQINLEGTCLESLPNQKDNKYDTLESVQVKNLERSTETFLHRINRSIALSSADKKENIVPAHPDFSAPHSSAFDGEFPKIPLVAHSPRLCSLVYLREN